MTGNGRSILFAGYAPVHYFCFEPLHVELERLAGVEVFVTGGLRKATETGYEYDTAGLFDSVGVPSDRVLTVPEASKRRFDLLFSANKRYLVPPENIGTSVQIFHGASFRNMGVRPENLAYDYFFTVGPYMERLFGASGLMDRNDARLVSVGFPKTDRLLNGRLNRESVLSRLGLSGERPILLYAPTGQRNNSLETFGPEVIRRLAREDRYDIVIKLHDHPKRGLDDALARVADVQSEHVRVLCDVDVTSLMVASDLLLTDASSVSSEFSLLDRPMVFLDVPDLIAEARARGALVDLETWGRRVGLTAGTVDEAVAAVRAGLDDPGQLSLIRCAMAADLFYNHGEATAAAISWSERYLLDARVP